MNRRRFLQGACATVALCTLPPVAARHATPAATLLLGPVAAAPALAAGARAAGLADAQPLASPMLHPDAALAQLRQLRGSRCVALMAPADAALFEQLAMANGSRLLSRGDHRALGGASRHRWQSASPRHSPAPLLAALAATPLLIDEQLLQPGAGRACAPAGFASWQLPGAELHCAELAACDGCRVAGLAQPPQLVPLTAAPLRWGTPPTTDWVAALGLALGLAAAGTAAPGGSAPRRYYIRGELPGAEAGEAFVSFLLDA